jgi:hypothetical protein
MDEENVSNSHEIRQAFRNSSKCYDSYLIRTVLSEYVIYWRQILKVFFRN